MISISIQVITQNRPASLKRLCESLVKARYAGDTNVQLTFHIESDADEITKHFIQNEFKWTHGPLQVRQRVQKGGLLAAITESWYPLTNDEYAIILEDDIEVGPLFYLWSKLSLIKYRYLPHANSQDPLDSMISTQLFGISLYTPRVQELTIPRRKIDPYSRLKQRAFLWQLPCSWGAVYFPDKWREFIGYIRARLQNTTSYPAESLLPPTISQTYPDFPHGNYEVYLPNSRSNAWKKSWKRYFIEMISLRAYVMVYPNYWNQTSFSTNWLEPGTHISPNSKVRKRIDEFRVPLIKSGYVSTSGLDVSDEQLVWFSFDSFQKLSELPVMDPFFNLTSFEGLQRGIDSVVIHPIVNQ